ncbi:unnamed protein product [Owenia fusiformis]|uniref:Uncharacterized protein n=1 Tax=Owenia fusiformis TaxID=6347 RepID=A0A8J1TC67_OWEFU|nr:unnamed protein product [Owenia fusiformis]
MTNILQQRERLTCWGLTIVTIVSGLVTIATALPMAPFIRGDFEPDIPLDYNELKKIGGGNTEIVFKLIKQIATAMHHCGINENNKEMERTYLTNTSVTCNDGSRAGYYIRKSAKSTRWIVFLEGGWCCFDRNSCHGRWINMKGYMSSLKWPKTKKGKGILSWNPEENPEFFHANMVYVPYCSSDSWSGNLKAEKKGDFSFMGSLIVEEVIKDLLPHGLQHAKKLLLTGSSAGGTGVLVNLDKIADMLKKVAPQVDVRGVSDSGWFLDNEPFRTVPCTDAHLCTPAETIKRGIAHWNGQVPKDCAAQYPTEHWRCYFGYRMYPTLRTPVFVVQHLFDEAQITFNNVGPPVKKEQWHYIHKVGEKIKNTLLNVSAVFAPACLSHIVLTRSDWKEVAIKDITLPHAIKCWEASSHETNHYRGKPHKHHSFSKKIRDKSLDLPEVIQVTGDDRLILGDDPKTLKPETADTTKIHIRPRGNGGRAWRGNKSGKGGRKRNRKRKNRRKNKDKKRQRHKRSLFFNLHDEHHVSSHQDTCTHHLIDHCAWPQCNLSCPKLRNPFTGEEMDFIDLLLQFGLDLNSIANALGIDLHTLMSMDHDKLLRMLTQQQ